MGEHFADGILALRHPMVAGVRGEGLLRAVVLAEPVAAQVMALAREAGFIVNAVAPDALRLAPPLVIEAHGSTPSSRRCRGCSTRPLVGELMATGRRGTG